MKVIKRDGTEVVFNDEKIVECVLAAFDAVDKEISDYAVEKADNIATFVTSKAQELETNNQTLTVEQIQDYVENGLMSLKRKDVAKAYVKYRDKRTRERNRKSHFMKTIKTKIDATDIQNQNANVDEMSFGGRKGEASNELMKSYALDYILSPMARRNHLRNRIYIHDMDNYPVGMHNCLSVPFDDLLANGFNTRQTDVRPANSVNTAFQLVAVIFQLQSLQQFGGVSATHLDWTMVPYIRKSFLKHYVVAWLKNTKEFIGLNLLNMLFDTYEERIEGMVIIRNKFEDWVDVHKEDFFRKTGLSFKDFYFGNSKLDPFYAQAALFDTINETKQAVEGMYHNLNTLQSRSGNEMVSLI